jgi:predicted negative regulator of RcsB-dependent stress response
VLTLLGLAVIGICAVGMLSGYTLYQGYQETSCSGTIIFDDAINGNTDATKTAFFAGTTSIATELTKFNNKSAQIFANISKLSTQQPYYANSMSLYTQSLQNISQIPNTAGNLLTLKYNTPLMSPTPNGQVDSTFPSILGNKDTKDSLVKKAYDGVLSG